jgi:hypothetical protein
VEAGVDSLDGQARLNHMSDIVDQLRRLPEPQCRPRKAAADEIERLRDQIDKMRAVISAGHDRPAPVTDGEIREFHRRLMAMGGVPSLVWEE